MATSAAASMSDKPRYSVPPSPASATPVMRWRSSTNIPVLSTEALNSHEAQLREQRRLRKEQGERRASLEVLEIRSINRTLDQQHRQDQREVARLAHERAELLRTNVTLRAELDEARASLKYLRRQSGGESVSKALGNSRQTTQSPTPSEGNRSSPDTKKGDLVERYQAGIYCCCSPTTASAVRGARNPERNTETSCNDSSYNSSIETSCNDSSYNSSIENASSTEADFGASEPEYLLPELIEQVHSSLTGTVSRWVKAMQADCCPQIKQALVLPWLLHKLFYLCSELIEEKRQEVSTLFVGGVECEPGSKEKVTTMSLDASEFMLRHLRRNRQTLFPLAGDRLRVAVDKIMMALAYSMIDSDEWDPSAKDPDAVFRALVASELGVIVEDYIVIMVMCCLQQPAVCFTDDLGEMQSFNPEVHCEPIDGEPGGDSCCIIVFPALMVAADGGETGSKTTVVGKRFVLRAAEE